MNRTTIGGESPSSLDEVKRAALIALGAFVGMEPVTYAAHRWLMHGAGWVLHRSHHRTARLASRLEANDWFPVAFAGLTVATMATGRSRSDKLLPLGAGVTAYGAAYLFVHDVYIHGRLGRLPRLPGLERLGDAHTLHHRFGGEPYGMLFPVVPATVRLRAASTPPHRSLVPGDPPADQEQAGGGVTRPGGRGTPSSRSGRPNLAAGRAAP